MKANKILHVSSSFFPATDFGGPIFSTRSITDGVNQFSDFEIGVLTTDAAKPKSWSRLPLSMQNTDWCDYPVCYCRKLGRSEFSLELILRLPLAIRGADVVHLTGPYSFTVLATLFLAKIFGKPLVWSLRGGVHATLEWKDAPKRRLKSFFHTVCSKLLTEKSVLHVTSVSEKSSAAMVFEGVRTEIIPNSVEIPVLPKKRVWRSNNELRIAFVSRIHEKKGLDRLIKCLSRLPSNFALDVYGSGSIAYVDYLKGLVFELGLQERVVFHGHVDGQEKSSAYSSCDVLVLPTHSENFGIVIAEALAHGTPVVTTTNAPWSGIEPNGCGRWIEYSEDSLYEAILSLKNSDLEAMGNRGRAWMEREFSVDRMNEKFRVLYSEISA